MPMPRGRLAALTVCAALAGCGGGGSVRSLGVPQTNEAESERVRPRVESAVQYPAAPQSGRLIAFRVSNAAAAQYFIDRDSITLPDDRTIRFTLVARIAGAPDAVSYEAFRCDGREHRVFGYGRDGGQWVDAKPSVWRRVPFGAGADYVATLHRDFFCPAGNSIKSAREGIDALVRGGHPEVAR
jgi:CNP1-like family